MQKTKNNKLFLSLLAFLFLLPSGGTLFIAPSVFANSESQTAKPIFGAKSFTLENGLTAVWIPNHRAPVAQHMVWYKVGAADEVLGKSGLAHFFEHLMFKGTPKYPDAIFSKKINSIGGEDNAFTGNDFTAYHQSIPVEYLPLVMEMEADRMQNLVLTKEVIETERQVILEERKQRVDTSAFARYSEKENAILYVNHPYSIPIIGWEHEIRNLSEDDIKDFYKQWYAPNNAVVVVAGDIEFDAFKALVEKNYGSLKPSEKMIARARPEIPQGIFSNLNVDLNYRDDQIAQNYFRKRFLVPSEKQDPKTSLALDIIAQELGSGEASLLYEELVTKQKKALSIGASYSSDTMDTGSFVFHATLAKGVAFADIEKEIDVILKKLVKDGISQERLSEIKARMAASAVYARDSLDTPAYIFGKALTIGLTLDDVEYWEQKLEQITKQEVDAVLVKYFSDLEQNTGVTGYLTPEVNQTPEENGEEAQP